jgi:ribosomal protein S18 acetylase RimI-like enzyme
MTTFPGTVQFRDATIEDLEIISQFVYEVYKVESKLISHYNPEYYLGKEFKDLLTKQIHSPKFKYTLAVSGETAIGLLEAELTEKLVFRNLTRASLLSLFVSEEYRGRGIAMAFLDMFEEWAKANDRESVDLIIVEDNDGADALYESFGYRDWEKRKEKIF